MKHLRLQVNQSGIDYDYEYGIDKRTGWSVFVDGSYIIQFERFLIVAVIKTIVLMRRSNRWEAGNTKRVKP